MLPANSKEHFAALCLSHLEQESQQRIFNALRNELQSIGYHLLVFNTFSDFYDDDCFSVGESGIFQLIPYEHIDCLILIPETIKSEKYQKLIIRRAKEHNVPLITIDKSNYSDGSHITFDYSVSMEQIVRHIVEDHGCKKVNFIAGVKGNLYSDERLDSYKKVLTENNIPIEEKRIGYGDFWEIPARKVIDRFLEEDDLPDAIICANDSMAIAVCERLHENGYSVPEDVIVTGFDGIEAERYFTPRLTTASIDLEAAAAAVRSIIQSIANGTYTPADISIAHKIIHSQSCGCAEKKVTNANDRVLKLYDSLARTCSFQEIMSGMVSSLTGGISFKDAIEQLPNHLSLFYFNYLSIFLVDNFFSNTLEEENNGCYPKMVRPILIRKGGELVKRESALPSDPSSILEELAKINDPVIFVPIHFQNIVTGYLICAEPSDYKQYRHLQLVQINLNYLFGIMHSQYTAKQALNHLQEVYNKDYMTGLWNRRGFYENIPKMIHLAKVRRQYLCLFSIDLDGLKYINDNYGHQEGDFAIKSLADGLTKSSVLSAICSRFGGDEFTVAMLSDNPDYDCKSYQDAVTSYIQDINATCQKPYPIDASFGYQYSVVDDAFSLDQLIRESDDLMYHIKSRKKHARSSEFVNTPSGNPSYNS